MTRVKFASKFKNLNNTSAERERLNFSFSFFFFFLQIEQFVAREKYGEINSRQIELEGRF